jgi:hypothetical protein
MSKEVKSPSFEIVSNITLDRDLSAFVLEQDGKMDLSMISKHMGTAWICSSCGDIKWQKSKVCEYCAVNSKATKTKWLEVRVTTSKHWKSMLRKRKEGRD